MSSEFSEHKFQGEAKIIICCAQELQKLTSDNSLDDLVLLVQDKKLNIQEHPIFVDFKKKIRLFEADLIKAENVLQEAEDFHEKCRNEYEKCNLILTTSEKFIQLISNQGK